uniref:HEAT repeat-containing protein 6 n=3 Tax=Lygus hesperus TaxID=30085 RepID=A0A0A9Z7Z6_LYGHE
MDFSAPATPSKIMKALYDALASPTPNSSLVNSALDKLITEVYSRSPVPSPGSGEWMKAMQCCCKKISPENPLLLAKCANILLVLIGTHQVSLKEHEIDSIVSWSCSGLTGAPDIVFIDFLQMLDALMKKEKEYFSSDCTELLNVLTSKLEDKASVSLPQDIRMWRITCLKTLSTSISHENLELIAASYFDAVFTLKPDEDRQSQCQLWINVLEGFEILCASSSEWIQPVLKHLVVAIHSAMTTGMNVSPSPTLQFPAHVIMSLPSELPPIKTRPVVRFKRRNRRKAKQVAWAENDTSTVRDDDRCNFKIERTTWISSSDSELSDSESGITKQHKKLEAHVRHAAYNLLIQLIKIVGCKSIFEWYCALFSRLIEAVQAETYSKPRCATFGALAILLSGSKMFLAQAQDNEGKSFTSFSEVLAIQLTTLHEALIYSLKHASLSETQLLTALFLATGAMIKVTPYSRLKPGLFESVISAIRPFTTSKDTYVVSCVLHCLIEVVGLPPVNEEISTIIATPTSDSESVPWILKYAISYLDEDVNGIRVFAWFVLSDLCQNHFNVIESQIDTIESRVLLELSSDKPLVAPLKALANLIDKYQCNQDYIKRVNNLWDELLQNNSPFLQAFQDPGKPAGVACDCLSLIGSKKFHMLSEDKKILIITLVFGCCVHELPFVRFSALNVLSNFLSYPQMSGEVQFMCDTKDYLIRALKDPVEHVRIKAAWAFSNLVDVLVDSNDEDLLAEVSIYELLQAALSLSSDTQKVKQNIMRAIGLVLLLVKPTDLEHSKWKDALEKACTMLQHCATTGSLMKMRWNACYTIATMLKNEFLYESLQPFMPSLLKSLCTIVISCNNFKVRMNACLALGSIKQRKVYGSLYIFVWQSLLEGLDNAANMTDFSEFKHQHGLFENLCATICHVCCFIQPGDSSELQELLDYRLDFLCSHIRQCQERVAPEQAGAILRATNHIESISKTYPEDRFFKNLLTAFQASQILVI